MISKNGSTTANGHSDPTQQMAGMAMVPVSIDGIGGRQDKNEEGFKLHPHQLWAAFCRHWFLSIVLGLLAAAPIAYLVWKHAPTPYRAEAAIMIRANRQKLSYELPEDRENFRTLKSREMQRVKLSGTLERALLEGEIAATRTIKEIPLGMSETYWLRNNLSVANSGVEVFTISLDGEYREELPKIVDAVAQAYLDQLAEEESKSSVGQYQAIDDEIEKLKTQVKEKRAQIIKKTLQIEGSAFDEDDVNRENDLRKRSELEAQVRAIEIELIGLKSQQDSLNKPAPDAQPDTPDAQIALSKMQSEGHLDEELDRLIAIDPRYIRHKSTLSQITRHIERWKQRFGTENLPEIQQLKEQLKDGKKHFADLQKTLKDEYRKQYRQSLQGGSDLNQEALRLRIQGLQAYLDGLEKELSDLNDNIKGEDVASLALEISTLKNDVEQEEKQLARLSDQQIAFEFEKGAAPRINWHYRAEVPTHRETRKRDIMTAGAGLGTFGFVVFLFTLIELRVSRVSSLKLLEDEFEFPILGTIPRLPVKVLQNPQSTRKAAVYKHNFMEAIDSARTVLLNQLKRNPAKIIMVTSALGGEGKSTLSSHLAISFARAGRKTLLIDGDLRRPRVHEVFQIPDFPGFCETLRGETPVEKCIYDSGIAGLDVMPAGEIDAYTLRMLAEPETHEIFANLRTEYDLVLFDSSPVLPVADSLLIMQSIDGVLLSIRKDHSRMSKVATALKKIDLVGGRILGGIVIGINEAEYGYGSSYYSDNMSKRVATTSGTSQG